MQAQATLLVTGGSGYIGACLTQMALEAGYKVHILDNAPAGNGLIQNWLQNYSCSYFEGSITDKEIISSAMTGVDFVVHLAGVSDGRAGKADPELTRRVNSDSIAQILDIAQQAGVQRFAFASTMGVYGNAYKTLLTEDLLLKPIDPYSESKAIGEECVRKAGNEHFVTTALRIAMVYGAGPRIREDFLVNRLCLDAVQKGELTITGGAQRRPQVHVKDLCSLFLAIMQYDRNIIAGQVFNMVESNPSLSEIVAAIQEALPQTVVNVLPGREHEDSFEMDGQKLAQVTAFRPSVDLKTGVQQTIQYFSALK